VFLRFLCGSLVSAALLAQPQSSGQLDSSYALFTVLAAINAAGYDADIRSPSNHPLRMEVLQAIEVRNPPSLAALREFYEKHRSETPQEELSKYISFGLCLQDPPSFKMRYERQQLPPEVQRLAGFEKILAQFHKEAGIEDLWKRAQPSLEAIIARYQTPVVEAVQQASLYLRNPMSGVRGRRFQIWIDVLGSPNQVHTRTFVDDYFIVITASPQLRIDDVRRAYLHYLIDPMMLGNAEKLEKKRPIQDLTQASPILDDVYKTDFPLLAGMCLVRAVEARLSPVAQRQAMVERAMSEGFILTAYFFEALPGYEKDQRAMRLYAPDMIDSINLAKEDQRIAKVQFASKREEHVIHVAAPKPVEPTGILKDIDTAERLYEQRDLERAKAAFRKVLETEGPRPVHARAYYGLARVAILEKNPALAEELFEKALDLDPEPQVRAWLHIYLARLSMAAQEPDKAVEQYKAALAVDGASDMARASAQKELAAAQNRKQP